jgi:hypothetical protein
MASSARGDAAGVDWVVVCVRRAVAGASGAQGREGPERNWKRTVLEKFAIEIFSKDLDRNVSISQSDGLRFSIGRSDGYQAIDDVEGSFAKTATRFEFLKMRSSFLSFSFHPSKRT